MTYLVLATGQSDSFPWPIGTAGTVGAGSGVTYTLQCVALLAATPIFTSTASVLVH